MRQKTSYGRRGRGTLWRYKRDLHISFTQLDTYLQCPRRYMYQYVMGVEWEHIPAAIPLGKSLHQPVAQCYLAIQQNGKPPPLDTLLSAFDDIWDKEGAHKKIKFDEEQSFGATKAQGRELLAVFYAELRAQRIVAVEYPFSVEMTDIKTGEVLPVKLIGAFDLVEADDENNLVVVDLKSTERRYSDNQLDTNLQSSVYSYAVVQLGWAPPDKDVLVRFDVLLKTKKAAMERYPVVRNSFDHRRVFGIIREVLRGIEQQIYHPRPGWYCADCPFKRKCDKEP